MTRVYLTFDYITKRNVGIADLSRVWVVAKWIARGTGTVLYKSKQCGALKHDDARTEAHKLARAWLARENARPSMSKNICAAMEWTGPRYEDTTTEEQR